MRRKRNKTRRKWEKTRRKLRRRILGLPRSIRTAERLSGTESIAVGGRVQLERDQRPTLLLLLLLQEYLILDASLTVDVIQEGFSRLLLLRRFP